MKEKKEHIEEIEIINEEMKLNACTTAPHPEMARNTTEDEPCEEAE